MPMRATIQEENWTKRGKQKPGRMAVPEAARAVAAGRAWA